MLLVDIKTLLHGRMLTLLTLRLKQLLVVEIFLHTLVGILAVQ
jgi:hypothetical protein